MQHINKSKLGRFLQAAITLGTLGSVALGGCSDSTDAKRRASQLAGGCSINSDCDPDFICAFERCHIPCTEDRDCKPDPLRCMKSEKTDIFVCQLEDERHCKDEKDCPGEQICGANDECRDPCEEADDCIADQVCTPSNECASNVPSKDMLDAAGNVIPDDPNPGSGGTPGEGPDPGPQGGSGGMTPEPSGGTGGSGGSDPVVSGGAGGVPGSGEAGSDVGNEAGGPNLPPVEFEESGDGVEVVDNDDRDHTVSITQSARFFLDEDDQDHDWFAYHAPDDGHAHILSLLLEQDASVATSMTVYAAQDDSVIDSHVLPKGTTRSIHVTVGPSTVTLFQFSPWSTGSRGFVTLTLTDQVEHDDHEPNNTRQTAPTIELGQSVAGQLLRPMQAIGVDLSQDWFAIELAQGTATVTFTGPSEGRATISYIPPTTVNPSVLFSPVVGALQATDTLTVTTAGTYYFGVRPYNESAIVTSSFIVKPAYFDEQYSFTITQ